jgi:DNA-binding transcriptional LysR family regulator
MHTRQRSINGASETNQNYEKLACGEILKSLEINSGAALYQAVLTGLGVGRIAAVLAEDDLKSGRLVGLLTDYEDDNDGGIYAIFPRHRYLLPKVRVFVDFLPFSSTKILKL